MSEREVVVPDLGDFKDVAVADVLVATGATIEKETPLRQRKKTFAGVYNTPFRIRDS